MATTEDQMKVAAPASHVEVAISLSKWPLAQVLAGTAAIALPASVLRGSPHRPIKCRETASTAPLEPVRRGDASGATLAANPRARGTTVASFPLKRPGSTRSKAHARLIGRLSRQRG
ncbi:hypothetical protein GCM10014715_33210 [Streptomyces spiralis]|uniref:Uncharacterized protein n=1 Tax=Streptomyces spiralis TaxID=66376 RepID=A0A918ZX58_9ACTN|nr:hypothetical protein GCM10014715_33210 [Streptomyces spiralis]